MQTPGSDNDLLPVWFHQPREFYAKVAELSELMHIAPEDVLRRALQALETDLKRKVAPKPSQQASQLSMHRWSKVPAAERSRLAQQLARKRWNSR